jgi:vacuolar-type H+-ATPase subunit E/Vma4
MIKKARRIVLEAVQELYPALVQQVREQITQIEDEARLRRLVIQVLKAPDEAAILALFRTPSV